MVAPEIATQIVRLLRMMTHVDLYGYGPMHSFVTCHSDSLWRSGN